MTFSAVLVYCHEDFDEKSTVQRIEHQDEIKTKTLECSDNIMQEKESEENRWIENEDKQIIQSDYEEYSEDDFDFE